MRLADAARFENLKVTLVGVVVESSIPRKSRGTDYVTVLRIVDDSLQNPEFIVNVFAKEAVLLPHVRSHGDLILLSNVKIEKHNQDWTAVCYKNSSSFALFDANVGNDFRFYQATPRFSLEDDEKRLITRVKQWRDGVQLSIGNGDFLSTMNGISVTRPFDIISKVLRLYYDVIEQVWMLILWDGTDAPPLSLYRKLRDEEQNPLPLHVYPSLVDDDFNSIFPPFGTFLKVSVHASHESFDQHFNHIGKWIRICYMRCKTSDGLWRGFLEPFSSVRLLSNIIINEYDTNAKKRALGTNTRVPTSVSNFSHFLTEVTNDFAMFSTLMDAIISREVNRNYHCVVRIVGIHPFEALSFCSDDESTEHSMRLTVEDSSARLHAFLIGVEMEYFFELCPIDERMNKIKLLLGISEEQSLDDYDAPPFSWNPLWTICCLKWVNGRLCVYSTRLKM